MYQIFEGLQTCVDCHAVTSCAVVLPDTSHKVTQWMSNNDKNQHNLDDLLQGPAGQVACMCE